MLNISRKWNLVRELALKDLKVRYQRPLLGFLWLLLSPLFTVSIFYLVFSLILKVRIEGAPFILYLMSAVFPWRFFQDSLMQSTTSLIDSRNLIKESGFAQYLIPVSIVLANVINFLPSLFILIIASLFVLKGLPPAIIFLPAILTLHTGITMGLAIIFSILYVKWRDIKYILESALLLLFYLTPVFYSLSLVKEAFPPLCFKFYLYNPFVCILSLYRMTILRGFYGIVQDDIGALYLVTLSVVFTAIVLAIGIYLYKRNRQNINDYLSY